MTQKIDFYVIIEEFAKSEKITIINRNQQYESFLNVLRYLCDFKFRYCNLHNKAEQYLYRWSEFCFRLGREFH